MQDPPVLLLLPVLSLLHLCLPGQHRTQEAVGSISRGGGSGTGAVPDRGQGTDGHHDPALLREGGPRL